MKPNRFAGRVVATAFLLFVLAVSSGGHLSPVTDAVAASESGWLVSLRDITAIPVARDDVSRLVDAGTIDTDGFSHMVLSLGGEMRSDPGQAGSIGAVLIPDMSPFDKVLEIEGLLAFPLEVKAAVNPKQSLIFMSEQVNAQIAFPRYRVYVYNTTDKTARAALFAYRTR